MLGKCWVCGIRKELAAIIIIYANLPDIKSPQLHVLLNGCLPATRR